MFVFSVCQVPLFSSVDEADAMKVAQIAVTMLGAVTHSEKVKHECCSSLYHF